MAGTRKRKMMTSRELADFLGHDPATLTQWRKKGCPARKSGNTFVFDREAVAAWLRERGYDGLPGRKSRKPKDVQLGPDGEPLDPDVRFRIRRCEKLEMEIGKLRGELVDRVEVDEQNVAKARLFRTGLLGLAARLAPVVAGMDSVAKIERRLRSEFEGLLREFARDSA